MFHRGSARANKPTQYLIAEQGGQPERRAARFHKSRVSGRRPVNLVVTSLLTAHVSRQILHASHAIHPIPASQVGVHLVPDDCLIEIDLLLPEEWRVVIALRIPTPDVSPTPGQRGDGGYRIWPKLPCGYSGRKFRWRSFSTAGTRQSVSSVFFVTGCICRISVTWCLSGFWSDPASLLSQASQDVVF